MSAGRRQKRTDMTRRGHRRIAHRQRSKRRLLAASIARAEERTVEAVEMPETGCDQQVTGERRALAA